MARMLQGVNLQEAYAGAGRKSDGLVEVVALTNDFAAEDSALVEVECEAL